MPMVSTDVSGREAEALQGNGFVLRRQRGSHMIFRREQPYARLVVPDHKQLRIGTLRQILHAAGLSVEQFLKLLGR